MTYPNEMLWAGPVLKIAHAHFHYFEMIRAVQPPEYTTHEIAQMASGAIVANNWQQRFYPHFDAFLMAAHSVPEIVQCCFGVDNRAPPHIKAWLKGLDPAETNRRGEFARQYAGCYGRFRRLPLSETRHIIEHRSGVPPIEVTVSSLFGVTYTGTPTRRLPDSTQSPVPNPVAWMSRPVPVPVPHYSAFTLDGKPLFEASEAYLNATQQLVQEARSICERVHGSHLLTPSPT